MNERIKVLMGFAGLQPYYDSQEEQMVKFAELIVRECIEALDENDGSVHHSECLLEHFGVEE
jgi:hypothetical protein